MLIFGKKVVEVEGRGGVIDFVVCTSTTFSSVAPWMLNKADKNDFQNWNY